MGQTIFDLLNSFIGYIKSLSLGDWGTIGAIVAPIVTVICFIVTQLKKRKLDFYNDFKGKYGGFNYSPIMNPEYNGTIYSGMILNIKHINKKGIFKGDFDFGETESSYTRGGLFLRHDSVHKFQGYLKYKKGKLYVVDNIDLKFKKNFKAEYEILYNRESSQIDFKLTKLRQQNLLLPREIILEKKQGLSGEPYDNVKITVFVHGTRCDIT